MFTEKCFIRKNTKELQDKLLNLSLKKNTLDDFKGNCLAVNYGMFISQYRLNELKEYEHNEDIDCGENEELFLAIAALRDDSNNEQFFICTESDEETEWVKGEFRLYEDCLFHYEDGDTVFPAYYWKKATVKELIEHFKK